jgi:ABC-type transporter Mla MlaB component
MPVIHLPENVTHLSLIDALAQNGALQDNWERTDVNFPPRCFVDQAAIALLCEWALYHQHQGRKVGFYGDSRVLQYLSRLDVFRHVDFDYTERFTRHSETGRFIPARLIAGEDDVFEASNAVSDLVLKQFENAHDFLPAMEWAVYEIIDNIRLHAETPVPGILTAQYYPQCHRLDIAIVDAGRGIKASLSQSHKLLSHDEAIQTAIQRGVTRDANVGQGNGMAGTCEIVRQNGGELHIWTGDADLTIRKGRNKGFTRISPFPGTGIFLRLDTRRPVRLHDTFISDRGWSFINYEAERIAEAGGIRIEDECLHTGGREPAKALRHKIEAILHTTDEPLMLDFSGIDFASSSFLDELLGRLVISLGQDRFAKLVRVAHLKPMLTDMANVVIEQRIQWSENIRHGNSQGSSGDWPG